jgi:hypothetical protein
MNLSSDFSTHSVNSLSLFRHPFNCTDPLVYPILTAGFVAFLQIGHKQLIISSLKLNSPNPLFTHTNSPKASHYFVIHSAYKFIPFPISL